MSRGGGRGGRGGFGRGRGMFSAGTQPPMGLTFTDIQSISREPTALYPTYDPLPILTEYSAEEKRICELQHGFVTRLRNSPYYLVESTKSTELPRYSDKYRPSPNSQPTLKRKDLHAPFFPPEIFQGYFNPRKKRKVEKKPNIKRLDLDEFNEDEEQDKSPEEQSDAGSQAHESDYDVEEEYDNDYAENYFDNGENDDLDDLGGGGGADDLGGGGDYD